jgi:hypothetical protein
MTVLPIVDRELRVAARQRATYWIRLGIASGAILAGLVVFIVTSSQAPAQTGRYIFEWLSGGLLGYCLAYGRRATADCLSQEKREGTLGLLFLTDLKGHDVVLGKLVATSVRGFYGLMAVFPVLAVPLLLGGTTSGEFWRVALVLMDTFLFSLAIGILGSAMSRDLQRVMGANIALLLSLMAAPPACKFALEYFAPGLPRLPQLMFSCPVYAFALCDDVRYGMARDYYWWSVGVIHALTWLLVLTAGWIVPRAWQDQPSRAQPSFWRDLWHTWRHGPAAGIAPFRKHALDTNAFYWLASRARFKPVHVWTFLVCLGIWWLVCWAISGSAWLDPAVAILTAVMLNFSFKVWLAIEAGRQLAEDRRTGAFELLLSVPLTVPDIVSGQLRALRRQFLKPVLVVLVVGVVLMMGFLRRVPGWQNQAPWLTGFFLLVADLVTLSWVGMWRALVSRSHNLATVSTVGRVLLLPWALFGVVVGTGSAWYTLVLGKEWSPGWKFYVELWLGLGLATDLAFGLTAWWTLRTRFRELALRRFNPAPSALALWLGLEDSPGAGSAEFHEPPHRDEHTEDRGNKYPVPFASPRLQPRPASALRWWALAGCLVLVTIGASFLAFRPRLSVPPPIVVSLTRSNAPVQVSPGPDGLLLILPDGSLWHWGRPLPPGIPATTVPERVGTNCDWIQTAGSYFHAVGLRRDGSLWEWGPPFPGRPGPLPADARPVDSRHDWVAVAASINHSLALRHDGTLWAWGDNSMSQLGNGPGPYEPKPVQVGTNIDWAAVHCVGNGTLALRRDGTLWAWGALVISGGSGGWGVAFSPLPIPTRLCLESNWTGFVDAFHIPLVQNRSGELWEPLHAFPNPEAPAASSFRLVTPHAVIGRFATAWCNGSAIYELRSDNTLWERTQPLGASTLTPVGQWHQVGKRSDWISLWSAGTTALGLTADGILWTWGVDPARQGTLNLMSRLKLAQTRLVTLFGPGPRPLPAPTVPAYQKQPRPLMRLLLANSAPPAAHPAAAGK